MAKGRYAEFFNRVDGNDPANSAIIIVPLSASGTTAQAQDLDTLSQVLTSGFFTERTGKFLCIRAWLYAESVQPPPGGCCDVTMPITEVPLAQAKFVVFEGFTARNQGGTNLGFGYIDTGDELLVDKYGVADIDTI